MSCTGTNSCGCGCNNGRIPTGPKGYNGWSPTFQTVVDEVNLDENGDYRVVLQLVSWIGGQGPIPTSFVNQYVSTTGYTSTLANATNIRGERGATTTITTGDEVPASCDLEGEIFIDVTTGIIYTCNGSTYESTSTTIINATTVLNLDISADVDKECMFEEITGNTLQDYLQGIINFVCANIAVDPSTPVYENEITFYEQIDLNVDPGISKVDIPTDGAMAIAASFAANYPITESVTKFTVPIDTTRVQFELFGGGGRGVSGGNENMLSAFIVKSTGSNLYYVLESDLGSASAAMINAGGSSNCPTQIIGTTGGTYIDFTNPGVALGGVAANGGYNFGDSNMSSGGGPYEATGGAGGSYGKVTLDVTPGDIYYIYTPADANNNRAPKVIIKY
jgi:hypothetical protein